MDFLWTLNPGKIKKIKDDQIKSANQPEIMTVIILKLCKLYQS